MTDQKPDNRAEKPDKPKPRRTGQRETIVAGKKYRLRVFLCKDAAGKKHSHSETFHGTAGQAEDRIREIIRRHRAGEAVKANADTFGAFLDEWLEAKRLGVVETAFETYERKVEKHIRPALGKKMLVTVTADDVQRFYGKLRAEGLSRASIGHIHTILSMVFKLATKRKKIVGSPMAGVELPKEWAEDEGDEDERAMTPDQVEKFLRRAEGNRFENLFKLAFHAGFRPGELLALKWADVDWEAKTVRVNQNIVWRQANDWYLKRPKTKKSKRTIPLTEAVVATLKSQRTAQLEDRLRAGKLWTDHDFVFADATGDPHPHWVLYGDFKRIVKAAGLPKNFSPKTARHTMASLLMNSGTNPKAVQERMGHARITTTLQQYTHVPRGEQASVSEEIERLLKAKK